MRGVGVLLAAVAVAVANVEAAQVCWLVTDKTNAATATNVLIEASGSAQGEYGGSVVYEQSGSQGGSGSYGGSSGNYGSSGSQGGGLTGNYGSSGSKGGSSGSKGGSGSNGVVGANGAQAWWNGKSGGLPYGVTIETYTLGSYNGGGSKGGKSNGWSSSSKTTDSLDGHNTKTYQTPWSQPNSRFGNSSWTYASTATTKPSSTTAWSSKTRSSAPASSSACVNSPNNRQCWGQYNIDTNYYTTTPDTGNTVEYWFDITNVTMAPDGVPRLMNVVNGQYPGPTIECNWGDTVVIHVQNNLENNGTSIHWHGLHQDMNSAMDGVPGVSQCPIPPGSSFTYTFRATSYGHTWYHSHFSLQYPDGILGPIVIHGPSSANWDLDLGPLAISDWFHTPASQLFFVEELPGLPIPGDTGLVQGKNIWNGSGDYYDMTFTPGKKHRIRLVNTSTNTHFKFSIDQHTMTVMAADFVPIEPYNTTVLNIGIGQRYDLVVVADQLVDNYWIRCVPATGCSSNNNQNGIQGIITYEGATLADPTSTEYIPDNTLCEDETGLVPVVQRDISALAYGTTEIVALPGTPIVRWTMNNSSFFTNFQDPTLLMVEEGNSSYPTEYNVVSLNGTENTWIYFVIQSDPTGTFAVNHPIHVHGHDFLLVGSGTGTFDQSVIANANFTNPTRRDVATMPASSFGAPTGGFIVLAFPLDNPGIWLLHCHIAWHQAEGLVLQFVERIDEIPNNVGVTQAFYDNCAVWDTYNTLYNPPRDDSGV